MNTKPFLSKRIACFLFFVLAPVCLVRAGLRPCDLIQGRSDFEKRFLGVSTKWSQEIADSVYGKPAINSHPRFQGHPTLSPQQFAEEQILEAFGAVEHLAPGRLSDISAAKWANTLADPSVYGVSSISFESMSTGLAEILLRVTNDYDSKITRLIDGNALVFKNSNSLYLPANYSLPYLLDDVRVVFEANPNLNTNNWVNTLASGTKGMPLEVRVAALKTKEGKSLLEVDSHDTYGGSDIIAVDEVYNVKFTPDGLNREIIVPGTQTPGNLGVLSQSGARVRDGIIAAAHDSKPYIFVVADSVPLTNQPLDTAKVQEAFNLLNNEQGLKDLGITLTLQNNLETASLK